MGQWVLDRQLLTFAGDPSGVFLRGQWERDANGDWVYDDRARFALGYQHGTDGHGGWRPRMLLPLTRDGGIDARALLRHAPNNYCNSTSNHVQCAGIETFGVRAGQGLAPVPLKEHIYNPCPL